MSDVDMRDADRASICREAVRDIMRPEVLRHDLLNCLAVGAVALFVRVIYLEQIEDFPLFAHPIGDSAGFWKWGHRIAEGDLFSVAATDPGISEQSTPLYPYFLGLVFRIAGEDYYRVRFVQMLVGAGSCVMLYWAGRAFFGRGVGLGAGLMLAFYPPAIFYNGLLQKGVLGQFFFCTALWILGGARSRPNLGRFFSAGLLLTLLSLDRENALPLLFALPVWIVWSFRTVAFRRKAGWVAAVLLGIGLVLVPVGLRNLTATGRLTWSGSNVGANFFIGNNARADGTYVPLRPGHGSSRYERSDARDIAERELGRALSSREVSRYWLDRSWQYIRAEPRDWIRLMGLKCLLVCSAMEIADTEDMYLYLEWSPWLRALSRVFHFGTLCPPAVAGVVITFSRRRDLSLLYLFALCTAAGVALFLVVGRYRFPLVPILILFCAAFPAGIPVTWRERRWQWLGGGLAVAIIAGVVCNWPLRSRASQDALARMNLGAALSAQERLEDAAKYLEEAIALDRTLAETHHNLGNVYYKQGDYQEAASCYRTALERSPELAEAYVGLGDALRKLGDDIQAQAAYLGAIALRPGLAAAHFGLGMIHAQSGRDADAVLEYEKAARLETDNGSFFYNLGNALFRLGRSRDAAQAYQRAIAADPGLASAYFNLATLHVELNEFDLAVRTLDEGLRVAPEDAEMKALLRRLRIQHPELK